MEPLWTTMAACPPKKKQERKKRHNCPPPPPKKRKKEQQENNNTHTPKKTDRRPGAVHHVALGALEPQPPLVVLSQVPLPRVLHQNGEAVVLASASSLQNGAKAGGDLMVCQTIISCCCLLGEGRGLLKTGVVVVLASSFFSGGRDPTEWVGFPLASACLASFGALPSCPVPPVEIGQNVYPCWGHD